MGQTVKDFWELGAAFSSCFPHYWKSGRREAPLFTEAQRILVWFSYLNVLNILGKWLGVAQ